MTPSCRVALSPLLSPHLVARQRSLGEANRRYQRPPLVFRCPLGRNRGGRRCPGRCCGRRRCCRPPVAPWFRRRRRPPACRPGRGMARPESPPLSPPVSPLSSPCCPLAVSHDNQTTRPQRSQDQKATVCVDRFMPRWRCLPWLGWAQFGSAWRGVPPVALSLCRPIRTSAVAPRLWRPALRRRDDARPPLRHPPAVAPASPPAGPVAPIHSGAPTPHTTDPGTEKVAPFTSCLTWPRCPGTPH